jgi:hypothetical protein
MCTWPLGVLGPCHSKTAPCIVLNQQYVNPTMLFDYWPHVTQCTMVAEQSNHLFPSHHLYSHCACAHGMWVFWDPVAANKLQCLPTNQQYVNPTMLFDLWQHLTQCSMVVEQSEHLFQSHHLQNHCACSGTLLQQNSSMHCH